MITISEDTILIEEHRKRATIRFTALGGPEDPIEATALDRDGDKVLTFAMSREDVDRFQLAFVNFLNTGYFDQEG